MRQLFLWICNILCNFETLQCAGAKKMRNALQFVVFPRCPLLGRLSSKEAAVARSGSFCHPGSCSYPCLPMHRLALAYPSRLCETKLQKHLMAGPVSDEKPIWTFETRTEISFSQSHVSRQEQECPLISNGKCLLCICPYVCQYVYLCLYLYLCVLVMFVQRVN